MPRRSRTHACLLLARVSNLPTVWTNVLAAVVVAGGPRDALMATMAAASLFYTGGMVLNDAFDAAVDATGRSDRPIPAGDVTRPEAFMFGAALMALGELVLLLVSHPRPALTWGLGLAAAIVFYDYKHKGQAFGPVVMGLCRALVYCVAAAAAVGTVSSPVFIAAALMWAYIIALTWVAKTAGLGSAVRWMLAGICLVDAVVLAVSGEPTLAALAAAGFVLTLALQRVVPGT